MKSIAIRRGGEGGGYYFFNDDNNNNRNLNGINWAIASRLIPADDRSPARWQGGAPLFQVPADK